MGTGYSLARRKRKRKAKTVDSVLAEQVSFQGDVVPILGDVFQRQPLTIPFPEREAKPREYQHDVHGKTVTETATGPLNREQTRAMFIEQTDHAKLQLEVCDLAARISPATFRVPSRVDTPYIEFADTIALLPVGRDALRLLGWSPNELRWLGPIKLFLEVVLGLLEAQNEAFARPQSEEALFPKEPDKELPDHPPPERKDAANSSRENGGRMSGLSPPASKDSRLLGTSGTEKFCADSDLRSRRSPVRNLAIGRCVTGE